MSTCKACADLRRNAKDPKTVRPCAACLTSSDVTADPPDPEVENLRARVASLELRLTNAHNRESALQVRLEEVERALVEERGKVESERKACAEIADAFQLYDPSWSNHHHSGAALAVEYIARNIRARGKAGAA